MYLFDSISAKRKSIVLFLFIMVSGVFAADQVRTTVTLSKNWYITQLDSEQPDIASLTSQAGDPDDTWLKADMPAQVHDILLAHGKISDPRIGKNAAQSAWVGQKSWAYACTFPTPKKNKGSVFLCFDGLDTLADAYLNGKHIGHFDNMYRWYSIDVEDKLASFGRANILLIVFHSPLRFIENFEKPEGYGNLAKHKFLRKCHSDFSSYLGARPHSVKVGIFRDVYLDLPGESRIDDVWIRTEVTPDLSKAKVIVEIESSGDAADLTWALLDPSGQKEREGTDRIEGKATFKFTVENPVLWWPRTHGAPNLHKLDVFLKHRKTILDSRTISFGIRDIKPVLVDLATGEKRFRFDINGQPIFLRGADWAPVEGMTHCWKPKRAERLLDLMEHGRMNVMRMWGEGHIPPDEFYDECDRRGILVWQDFMFGYNMHPSGVKEFDENCKAEVEGMIRRLRNHPCILLWCGGNENHMGWNFRDGTIATVGNELFTEIMPRACAELDSTRLFHPSSPFGGRVPNWPLEGDWHDYSTLKFCPDASVPLYASEVGRASAMPLSSMKKFLSPEELWPEGYDPAVRVPGKPAWPPMWQYRSVGGSWDKVGEVEQYCDAKTASELIRVLGSAHGDYLHDRVERQRRGVPDGFPDGNRRCWGNMVWRLNDSWPILYWSIIDYYLQPKMAYYYLRRAYDPVLVSFEQTNDKINVWITNDSPEPVEGTLVVKKRRFDGRTLGQMQADVNVAPGESRRVLDLTDFDTIVMRHEFLQADFLDSYATHLLIGERYLHLPRATLKVRKLEDQLEISTNRFAYQIAIEAEDTIGAIYEDNYFNLPPGRTKIVRLHDTTGGINIKVAAFNSDSITINID